jgi:hypothetical protein
MAERFAGEQLVVETRRHRRTALVALRGELDIVTVSKIARSSTAWNRRPTAYATSCWTYAG